MAEGDRPNAPPKQPVGPILLSMMGAVCGTLVSQTLAKSQSLALVGATLGAAIPPLISAAGPRSTLRATGGLLIAAVALLFTYGGFTLADMVRDSPSTFPAPAVLSGHGKQAETTTSATTVPADSSSTSPGQVATCEGPKCFAVSPISVHCSVDACDPVTLTNTGSVDVHVMGIQLEGARATDVDIGGLCDHRTLLPKDACSITLTRKSTLPGTATLVVHQDLLGPATVVTLNLDGPATDPQGPDLALFTEPHCDFIPNGSLNGKDELTIWVGVRNNGPGDLGSLAPFAVTSDTGLAGGGNTALSTTQPGTPVQVELRPGDFSRSHTFTIVADPENKIVEANESNNTLGIVVTLPSRPASTTDVPCTVSP